MRFLAPILVLLAVLALWDLGWWLGFGVPPLSPFALREALRRDDPPTVIDVRTPAEYDFFHIRGAVNLPYPVSLAELAAVSPDPTKPVVVVCMTGHRSPPVARQLQKGGYTDVRNLTWGMLAWKLTGGDTESGK
ncbi:rhodanese-like domain-containing protein [Pseudodesulfovibrio portus]|uniref:Rhodanese domain-containing protein n=1 Tax=Pseudodesulfovibrio portus TaxID=231439 RepID=A0ABM8ASQ2_9BACT|nr:rhodanese-like domain-containing protein [Pseudodesulfovibrio portus]BDQ34396.1 hypothetical protein JCM14722_19380 [Pseudodesulfovibrio portus]